MRHERNPCLFEEPHDWLYTVYYVSGRWALWAHLCQILQGCQDSENLPLPQTHVDLQDNRHNSCFNINSCEGPNLEITCGKWWPLSLILSPVSKPHNHCYDVSKMFDFPDALELLPETWLQHIFSASYLIQGIMFTNDGQVNPMNSASL